MIICTSMLIESVLMVFCGPRCKPNCCLMAEPCTPPSCIWSAPSAWGAVFLLIIAIGLPLYLGTYTMNGPCIIVLSYTCYIPWFISYGEGLSYRSHSHLTSIYVLIDRIELLVLLSWSQRNPLLKPGRSDSPEKWWTPWI